jgi:hypothetical protein
MVFNKRMEKERERKEEKEQGITIAAICSQ